jgi:hypothetical protein
LTFDWSNIDFLSYLENLVALSHISEVHNLLRKLSHTRALHELSLLLKNFYLQGNFCAYWLLTINYILVYFWNVIWLFYQLFVHACSKANARKFLFCIFPSTFQLLVWRVRTDMFLRPDVLGSVNLLFDSMPSGLVCTTSGREFFAFSVKHTYTHTTFCLFYHVVLCVFSLGLIPSFWYSLHIFSHSQVFPLTFLILLSFCSF